MAAQISLIGIMVEDFESTAKINDYLHDGRCNVLGRMGLPNAKDNISVISVVLDAPKEDVAKLAEDLAALPGVSVTTLSS